MWSSVRTSYQADGFSHVLGNVLLTADPDGHRTDRGAGPYPQLH